MAHTFADLLAHVIFSTKERARRGEIYSRPGPTSPQDFVSRRIHHLFETPRDSLRRAIHLSQMFFSILLSFGGNLLDQRIRGGSHGLERLSPG